ncbi:hypothetical protein LUZ60_000478 [Juncus effusus]|nr:hypothetical protein LUZ60_000478 [Juncus effusus]
MNQVFFFRALLQLSLLVLCLSSSQDFISIDCGAEVNYTDPITNIFYSTDDRYINTGENFPIELNNLTSIPYLDQTVRFFESEKDDRHCYALNATKGNRYLVRATFLYAKCQKENITLPVQFDLYVGNSRWTTVNVTRPSNEYAFEVISIALTDIIWVCLVNTGNGDPFISALELRPMNNNLYPVNDDQSFSLLFRYNYGPTGHQVIRYPDDPYDRIWTPYTYNTTVLEEMTTSGSNNHIDDEHNEYEVPDSILLTAITPVSSQTLTAAQWSEEINSYSSENLQYYAIFHIVELEENVMRQFDILIDGVTWQESVSPLVNRADYDRNRGNFTGQSNNVLTLEASQNSTDRPLINGLEIYSILDINSDDMTDINDINAIMEIKEQYNITKNWMVDPCTPDQYRWDGIHCDTTTVTLLNLSSSELKGKISDSFSKLQSLRTLDLSNNSLTGKIPDFLGNMPSLTSLNLKGNHLSGGTPDNLKKLGSNLEVDDSNISKTKKKVSKLLIATVLLIFVVLVLLSGFIIMWLKKRAETIRSNSFRKIGEAESRINNNRLTDSHGNILQIEAQQFTYEDLQRITSKFEKIIGRGGFGTVYHGCLDNGAQVAVKVLSVSSAQGNREFFAEVMHLSRIHHKNLLSMVGYCKDGAFMALVYDYMPNGNLQDYIRGSETNLQVLSWVERLRVLVEASQGLEYLHKGCEPQIIHRDVKTSNVLLNQKLEAKISDFGLSRALSNDLYTHISTNVVGTFGYVDPQYQLTFQLNEKSDVYSFGVVILEVITAQPPIITGIQNVHITQWVRQRLASEGMYEIIDVKLLGLYDISSATKVVNLALKCTVDIAAQRPVISDVVSELKDCIELASVYKGGCSSSSQENLSGNTHGGDLYLSEVLSPR